MSTFQEYMDSQEKFISKLAPGGCSTFYATMIERGLEKMQSNPRVPADVLNMPKDQQIEFLKTHEFSEGGLKNLYVLLEKRINELEEQRKTKKFEFEESMQFDGDLEKLAERIRGFVDHGYSGREAVQLAQDKRFDPTMNDEDGFFVRPSEREQAAINDDKGYWSIEVADIWGKVNFPMLQRKYVLDDVMTVDAEGNVVISQKQHETWVDLHNDFLNRRMEIQPIGPEAQAWIKRICKLEIKELPTYNELKQHLSSKDFNWREEQMIWASWRGKFAKQCMEVTSLIDKTYNEISQNNEIVNKKQALLEVMMTILSNNQEMRNKDRLTIAKHCNQLLQQL